MNALPAHIDATNGVSFVETAPGQWTVTVDGIDERTITQDERGFVAWIGCQDRHWCFARALDACVEHSRYHRQVAEETAARREQAIAALMAMTPAQKSRAIERLQTERDLLDYADSEVNTVARKDEIDRRIASLRGAA